VNLDTVNIDEIRLDIKDLIRNTSHLIGQFESHVKDTNKHQIPPCRFHNSLITRLWGIAVMAVSGLAISIWGVISKGH
jgi:hypothetical protein